MRVCPSTPRSVADRRITFPQNTERPMAGWKGIVAQAFDADAFDEYCHTLKWDAWRPSFIVLHNTQIPSLAERPTGFSLTHMRQLEAFYRDTQEWRAGPHLFVDDK